MLDFRLVLVPEFGELTQEIGVTSRFPETHMESILNNDKLILFMVFVFPGLVSMHVYRLMMPARAIDWATALLEGVFYSIANFALTLPLLALITGDGFSSAHPLSFWFILLAILIVFPMVWPSIWARLLRNSRLMKGLQSPHPTAWDWFFDTRRPVFMLVHLKNGKTIGGYYGKGSFASSYPLDGDLYLRAIYEIDSQHRFKGPIPYTRGLLIRKDEYSYIELFDVPESKYSQSDRKGTQQ
jgi:hypothetical protein